MYSRVLAHVRVTLWMQMWMDYTEGEACLTVALQQSTVLSGIKPFSFLLSMNPPKPNDVPLSREAATFLSVLFCLSSLGIIFCKTGVTEGLGHTWVGHQPQKYFITNW